MAANSRRHQRRRARFAAALEHPDAATLRAVAAEASHTESAACDLGLEVDRAWEGLALPDADLLRYHARAAGVSTTLLRATHSWIAARRMRAARALGDLRLAEGVRELDRLLHDRDPRVRLAAARALGRIATPDAARILIAALEDGLLPEQRLVEVLGAPWAAGALLLAFRAPRTVAMRVPLADALGRAAGSPGGGGVRGRDARGGDRAADPDRARPGPDRLARCGRGGAGGDGGLQLARARPGGLVAGANGRPRGHVASRAWARGRLALGARQLHRRAAPAGPGAGARYSKRSASSVIAMSRMWKPRMSAVPPASDTIT